MSNATSHQLFINGRWRAGGSGATLPVINPATEMVYASVASATISDLDEALASAERSRKAWSSWPAKDRGQILVAAAKILAAKVEAAARDLSAEQGKTIAEASGEYARAVETLEWNGTHAEELSAPIPMGPNRVIIPEPLGVVAAFTPWNYPAVLIARKLAPALAAGCAVILKGAEETPSAAVHFVEALQEAGLPDGVVNLVFGVPVQISRHLLSSPIVKVLTFTGSTEVGKQLAKLAANNLQRCILELGGHSPVIVCEDADLTTAIPAISDYKFECAGQSCNAPSRILVARPLYEEFLCRMTQAARKIKIGPPEDPATEMGPMANARRIEAMQRLVKDAVDRGATVETGGTRLGQPGFYWPPTILTGVPKDAKVLHDEPFGPVLTVAPFDTIEEAIEEANATDYGLAAYLFTGADDTKRALIGGLSAGALSVNYLKGVSADAPYGGLKQSGYGYEGGEQGVRSFQSLKLVNGFDSCGRVFVNRTRSTIAGEDITKSVADALQYISYYHPPDYIRYLSRAYTREQSPAAKNAIGQILLNSRMAAFGRRPICQDTGLVVVFAKVGMDARIKSTASFADLVNEGVRRAYLDADNPLRPSIVADPLVGRINTRDNTPAVIHVDLVPGNRIEITIAAKGGGSENKARFATLNPGASVADWVVDTVSTLGSGWCPPGLISVGIGGSAEKAMLLAKEAMNEPIDMSELIARGPSNAEEALRIELYERINALGIGAQGLGGLTTVVDVKVATYPTHAASKPVALIPQCAANRHLKFTLDGSGPVRLEPPDLFEWPQIGHEDLHTAGVRRVNLDALTKEETASWRCGETLLLYGKMLTGRDAAHHRMVELIDAGKPLPVDLRGRVIYYVGPVRAVKGEVVGPAGPTTSSRMDGFTEKMLAGTGLYAMVGKAERGPLAIESIVKHRTPYLIAVGGAAYLISKSIKAARLVAFEDLGMEAIYEFEVEDMPVIMAIDVEGNSIHNDGPLEWRKRMAADSIALSIGV